MAYKCPICNAHSESHRSNCKTVMTAGGWPLGAAPMGIPVLPNKPMSLSNYGSVIVNKLGLDSGMVLVEEVADFYLLTEMTLDMPVLLPQLRAKTHKLALQLARYLELACMGEARHWQRTSTNNRPKLRGKDWQAFTYAIGHANDDVDSRISTYLLWDGQYKLYGRRCHLFINTIFSRFHWGGSYGGPKWAACIRLVLDYRRGRLSDAVFVDQAIGLEHNGNIAYDKVWNVDGLREVMDANMHGHMCALENYASAGVMEKRREWKEVGYGQTEEA